MGCNSWWRQDFSNFIWPIKPETNMNNHRILVTKLLSSCDSRSRLLFGALTSERLRSCCFIACGAGELWDLYTSTIDDCFHSITSNTDLDKKVIEAAKVALKNFVPTGGEHLQAQGQASVVCLIESLRFVLDEGEEGAEANVNSVVDALDNYTFYMYRAITGKAVSPDDYLLLHRELQRQLDDISFSVNNKKLSEMDVTNRRIENCQFMIPVAVG